LGEITRHALPQQPCPSRSPPDLKLLLLISRSEKEMSVSMV